MRNGEPKREPVPHSGRSPGPVRCSHVPSSLGPREPLTLYVSCPLPFSGPTFSFGLSASTATRKSSLLCPQRSPISAHPNTHVVLFSAPSRRLCALPGQMGAVRFALRAQDSAWSTCWVWFECVCFWARPWLVRKMQMTMDSVVFRLFGLQGTETPSLKQKRETDAMVEWGFRLNSAMCCQTSWGDGTRG